MVAGLPAAVAADLIDARIEADHPLPAFRPSQLNTYGGILFDVFGRQPLAYVSSYSQAIGDAAWSTMSTSIAAGVFSFGGISLSAASLPENAAAGTVVGELWSDTLTNWGDRFDFVPGPGDDDNLRFDVFRDEEGIFPRSFLVARGPFDYEADPRLSILVRATSVDGVGFERVITLDVEDVPEQRIVEVASSETVVLDGPLWSRDTLVVRGGGRVILDSPNAHTGGVVVEAGELVVLHPAALGAGPLEVRGGARVSFEVGTEVVALSRLDLADTAEVDVGLGRCRGIPCAHSGGARHSHGTLRRCADICWRLHHHNVGHGHRRARRDLQHRW